MPSPFPGMDPYLEGRAIWPRVHARLIVGISDYLTPLVEPGYYVEIEERVYITRVMPEGRSSSLRTLRCSLRPKRRRPPAGRRSPPP